MAEAIEDPRAIRAEAARWLIASGELEPLDGLAAVVWPNGELEAASRGGRPPGHAFGAPRAFKLRALELLAAGYSQRQAGEQLGVPRTTIQVWARQARAAGQPA